MTTFGAAETTPIATTPRGTELTLVPISGLCNSQRTQQPNRFLVSETPTPATFRIGPNLQLENCHQSKTTQTCGEHSKSQVSQRVVLTTSPLVLTQQMNDVVHRVTSLQISEWIHRVTSQVVFLAVVAHHKFVAPALAVLVGELVATCQLQLQPDSFCLQYFSEPSCGVQQQSCSLLLQLSDSLLSSSLAKSPKRVTGQQLLQA
ncbi:unannotated protein [freshwater metagenome]|uniref:Unannotated protein n=1 Tax=freshwater metagenome TaxID=449393 RepID=A0A6J7SZ07_9ZZZZ